MVLCADDILVLELSLFSKKCSESLFKFRSKPLKSKSGFFYLDCKFSLLVAPVFAVFALVDVRFDS